MLNIKCMFFEERFDEAALSNMKSLNIKLLKSNDTKTIVDLPALLTLHMLMNVFKLNGKHPLFQDEFN
jgi:hypothetical protein